MSFTQKVDARNVMAIHKQVQDLLEAEPFGVLFAGQQEAGSAGGGASAGEAVRGCVRALGHARLLPRF